jgi:hypothetical protein
MQYHAAKRRLVLQMTAAPEFPLALIVPPVARKLKSIESSEIYYSES